uniref:DUF2263 domain-containing protein n=1 Tax=Ascaris lumbricoides TaxID=6252 RepID=A0A0M3HZL5_ASCLU
MARSDTTDVLLVKRSTPVKKNAEVDNDVRFSNQFTGYPTSNACQPLSLQQLHAREIDLIRHREDRKAVLSDGGRPDMTTRFSAWETASESCVANRRSHLAATPDPFEFLPFCSYNLGGNLTNTIGRSDAELRAADALDVSIAGATFSGAPRNFHQVFLDGPSARSTGKLSEELGRIVPRYCMLMRATWSQPEVLRRCVWISSELVA